MLSQMTSVTLDMLVLSTKEEKFQLELYISSFAIRQQKQQTHTDTNRQTDDSMNRKTALGLS